MFFRICDNAGVPEKDIVHLCMISPKYLKWWQTHYGTPTPIGELLYAAQKQAFADKKKVKMSVDISNPIWQNSGRSGRPETIEFVDNSNNIYIPNIYARAL